MDSKKWKLILLIYFSAILGRVIQFVGYIRKILFLDIKLIEKGSIVDKNDKKSKRKRMCDII